MSRISQSEFARAAATVQQDLLFYFVWRVFSELHENGGSTFVPNWHIKAMCYELERMYRGENLRLVITVPPRHLKSITVAVALPAWLLGRDPSCKIIVASYGLDLARKHSLDCRQVMESAWYRELFSNTFLATRGSTQDEIRTTAGGGRKAVSIGGAVTGHGADWIIVDDLLKAGEAESPAELERAQIFMESSLLTRFNDPGQGRLVVVQQRLHEMDPAGYLLTKGTSQHLNLTAIAEEDTEIRISAGGIHRRRKGEALFPQRMNLDVLERLRKELGPAAFAMQYQQNPVSAGGSALRWEWFGIYIIAPHLANFELIVQSWDTATSADPRSDYSVCSTWGFFEEKWYLLDIFRRQLIFPELKQQAIALARLWKPDVVLIEDATSGRPLLQELRNVGPRSRYVPIKPKVDKETRFAAVLAPIEEGTVLLPREAEWLPAFKRELQGFPRAAHDDQVDSVSQFLMWTMGKGFLRSLGHDHPLRQERRERLRNKPRLRR